MRDDHPSELYQNP